jgi:hypothetical protein
MSNPDHFEFNPVNPLELEEDELNLYFQRFRKAWYLDDSHDVPQTYRGSSDLINLVNQQSMGVGAIIRFWQTDLAEFYIVTHKGLLPRRFNGDEKDVIKPPFTRLDTDHKGIPYAWNIEAHELLKREDIDYLFL